MKCHRTTSNFFFFLLFQAANPGCLLEDFVRWYSPRDWLDEESSEDCPEPSTTSQIAAMDKELNCGEEEEEEAEASTQLQGKDSISGGDIVAMNVGVPAAEDGGSGDGDGWDHEGWGEDDWDVVEDSVEEDERKSPLSHEEDVKSSTAIRVRSGLNWNRSSNFCHFIFFFFFFKERA